MRQKKGFGSKDLESLQTWIEEGINGFGYWLNGVQIVEMTFNYEENQVSRNSTLGKYWDVYFFGNAKLASQGYY